MKTNYTLLRALSKNSNATEIPDMKSTTRGVALASGLKPIKLAV